MSLTWASLIAIREELPVRNLGITLDSPLQDGQLAGESMPTRDDVRLRHWYRIGPNQFVRSTLLDGARFKEFAWAASAAALARVLTGDSLFDDQAIAQSPRDLFLAASGCSVSAIEQRAAAFTPRQQYTWTDGRTRLIGLDRHYFYFRLEAAPGLDHPIAFRVFPKMEYVGNTEPGAAPNNARAMPLDNSGAVEGRPPGS